MKHINTNPATILYWVYCVLNRNFANRVDITRGSLCKRYTANKYDIDISVHSITLDQLESRLGSELSCIGYTRTAYGYTKKFENSTVNINLVRYGKELKLSIFRYKA